MRFQVPDLSRKNNKIQRNRYSLPFTLIYELIKYFSSKENQYFLCLSCVQLATWTKLNLLPSDLSPTGPFSTLIPLLLCLTLELCIKTVSWIQIAIQDLKHNSKIYQLTNLHIIKSSNLYPGHVIELKEGDISPVDGILINSDTSYAKVSDKLITGEAYPKYVQCVKLDQTKLNTAIQNSNQMWTLNSNVTTTANNMIYSGTQILSTKVQLWVVNCGSDRKHLPTSSSKSTPSGTVDAQIKSVMINFNLWCLIVGICLLTFTKWMLTPDSTISFIPFWLVQSWCLLNSIVPFSIKIILIGTRAFHAKCGRFEESKHVTVNSPSLIDDMHSIQHFVVDKTGTLTQNQMSVIGFVENDSTQFTTSISTDFEKILALSPQIRDFRPLTTEDEALCFRLKTTDQTLTYKMFGSSHQVTWSHDKFIFQSNDFQNMAFDTWHKIPVDGLDFTFERKRSSQLFRDETDTSRFLVCKGSINSIRSVVKSKYEATLDLIVDTLTREHPEARVLVFASRKVSRSEFLNPEILETGLTLHGLVALSDPLQVGVKKCILGLGVPVSMCTGDRLETALEIGRQSGILGENTIVVKGSDCALATIPGKNTNMIVYECTPNQKKLCTRMIQKKSKVCCVGDGFNDLSMFGVADISVSIGDCSSVQSNSHFNISRFEKLNDLRLVSRKSLNITTWLIQFTFFRTALVTAALFAFSCLTCSGSLLTGFVLQGFNFLWTIWTMCVVVLQRDPKIGRESGGLNLVLWATYGILLGISLVVVTHLKFIGIGKDFSDLMGLILICVVNLIGVLRVSTKGLHVIGALIGIGMFLVYLTVLGDGIQNLFGLISELKLDYWAMVGICVLGWKVYVFN